MKKKRFKIRHLLIILILSYLISSLVCRQIEIIKLSRLEAQIKEEMVEALEEQEALKRKIELLYTKDYIEALARDELGLVKPGEIIYRYIRDDVDLLD